MKRAGLLLTIAALLASGCRHMTNFVDTTPPGPPSGIRTQTGDNFLELFWIDSDEPDVAGYNIFVSSAYDGWYELIGSTRGTYFLDDGARNGNTYYYAITAFDYDGNESGLSRDIVYDVPRPEGYDVALYDYRQTIAGSGYDFSDYAVVPYNDPYADMYFENYNGQYYMNVWNESGFETDIQDMGYTNSLLDVRVAPSSGWSPTHDVRLYVGHTYVVWTHNNHYAKFRVTAIPGDRVVFDWAYQLQEGNPMLKPGGAYEHGHSVSSRNTVRSGGL